jgi:beta-glucanase (GH16 family)
MQKKDMKTFLPVLMLCLFGHVLNAQTLPIDFDDVSDQFTVFGGSSFTKGTDPEDPGNTVGVFTNNAGDIWEGFFIDLSRDINLDNDKILTLSFYQSDSGSHNILLKLERGDGPDVEVLRTSTGQGWKKNVSFDFSNASISGTGTIIDATGNYSRLTLFIDGGVAASGSFFIDDINDGSVSSGPNDLDVIYDELVWSDEFNGPSGPINKTNWFHQTQLPAGGSWFNGEQQHYTNRIENSFVDNGFLNIVAIKESFTDQGETKDYTSARLNSKFAFTYGRVDVRAKLPFGDGTWPAIWTIGKNINEAGAYWQTQGFGEVSWPACGELDIMEHGLYADNEVSVAIHNPSSFGATIYTATKLLNDVANEFHVYSMNWSPNEIAFMIDNEVIYRYNPANKNASNWPFDADQYLILNIAMGGVSGAIDPNFVESSMLIDYVRVYQSAELSTEEFDLAKVDLYPNPAQDLLFLQTALPIDKAEVYSALGQRVLTQNNMTDRLDISKLAKGLYLLQLFSGNQRETLRFIKD